VSHEVQYSQRSVVIPGEVPKLCLSSSAADVPLFFEGRFTSPKNAAELLLALSQVVGSRFYTPPGMVARLIRESDPIVTCTQEQIRWEGFSSCCSVYARVDMPQGALEGSLITPGTTNVDFGPEMRDALAAARTSASCALSVGREFVEITTTEKVMERRVKVPRRWLQALIEAQHHQLTMKLFFEVSGNDLRRFLHGLPKGKSRQDAFVQKAARGLRLGFRENTGSLKLAGWDRLRVLERLLSQARSLKIYGNDAGATGWQVMTKDSRFHLLLSPSSSRGFSGEGQTLFELSQERNEEMERETLKALGWRCCSPARLEVETGYSPVELSQSLSCLSALGKVGYDLEHEGFFRRELPFPWDDFAALHPRLKAARALLSGVEFEHGVAWVKSSDTQYKVAWEGSRATCTCPWFSTHGLGRGPCKHILAAQWSLRE
jgi:SWIM zinc finger